MKRDIDLVRKILLEVEESNSTLGYIDIKIDGFSNEEISYHIKLLKQAGLLEAFDLTDSGGLDWKASSLTWDGHEFLEAAKNPNRWEEAKTKILSKGGNFTFEILKIVLSESLKNAIM